MTWTVMVETASRTIYIQCVERTTAEDILYRIEEAIHATIVVVPEERNVQLRYYERYDRDSCGKGKEFIFNPAHIVSAKIVGVDS